MEADLSCFNEQFRLFVRNRDLVAIRALLTTATANPTAIPFPCPVYPEARMNFVNQPLEGHRGIFALQYMPRERLGEFIDAMANEPLLSRYEILLHGLIGTGKSYLLAAYALFMLCSSRLSDGKTVERVVYISNCRKADVSMVEVLTFALLLHFPEDSAVIQQLFPNGEWNPSVYNFIDWKRASGFKFLFIVDDWDFYRDQHTEQARCLRRLFRNGRTVYGVSGDRDYARANVANDAVLFLTGLTDGEWMNGWKQSCVAFQGLHGEEEAQFLFLTGRNPLILRKLANADGNLRHRMHQANQTEGGAWWIAELVLRFYEEHVLALQSAELRELRSSDYFNAMMDVIACSRTQSAVSELYMSKLFEKAVGIVHPVCGIVTAVLADSLQRLMHDRMIGRLTPGWMEGVLTRANVNPCAQRFAFELYCLERIQDPHIFRSAVLTRCNLRQGESVIRAVSCKRLFDVCPESYHLSFEEESAVLLWPYQWNLPYVNGVIRCISNVPYIRTDEPQLNTDVERRMQAASNSARDVIHARDSSAGPIMKRTKLISISQMSSTASSQPARANRERKESTSLTEKSAPAPMRLRRLTRIISVKVTLTPPIQHADTLEFYRDDYRAYEMISDRDNDGLVEHYLLWIVPYNQVNRATPELTLDRPDFKGQHVVAADLHGSFSNYYRELWNRSNLTD